MIYNNCCHYSLTRMMARPRNTLGGPDGRCRRQSWTYRTNWAAGRHMQKTVLRNSLLPWKLPPLVWRTFLPNEINLMSRYVKIIFNSFVTFKIVVTFSSMTYLSPLFLSFSLGLMMWFNCILGLQNLLLFQHDSLGTGTNIIEHTLF